MATREDPRKRQDSCAGLNLNQFPLAAMLAAEIG